MHRENFQGKMWEHVQQQKLAHRSFQRLYVSFLNIFYVHQVTVNNFWKELFQWVFRSGNQGLLLNNSTSVFPNNFFFFFRVLLTGKGLYLNFRIFLHPLLLLKIYRFLSVPEEICEQYALLHGNFKSLVTCSIHEYKTYVKKMVRQYISTVNQIQLDGSCCWRRHSAKIGAWIRSQ